MYAELESLTVQVGQLRRGAPGEGARTLGVDSAEKMDIEDEEYEQEARTLREEALGEAGVAALDLKTLPEGWYDDRRDMFERGTRELAALAGMVNSSEEAGNAAKGPSLTETVGRVQRAKTVAMEFD